MTTPNTEASEGWEDRLELYIAQCNDGYGSYSPDWNEIKAFIATLLQEREREAVAEFAREVVALSDRIELEGPDGGTKQWMAFKRFRNTVRGIAKERGIQL